MWRARIAIASEPGSVVSRISRLRSNRRASSSRRLTASRCRSLAAADSRLATSLTAKYDFFAQCEFGIALENNNLLNGYITEKIFNVLISGAIPIYVGPPDAESELWPDMYIPAQRFATYDDLIAHLLKLSDAEKEALRRKGREFLESADAVKFSDTVFIATIRDAIQKCLNAPVETV